MLQASTQAASITFLYFVETLLGFLLVIKGIASQGPRVSVGSRMAHVAVSTVDMCGVKSGGTCYSSVPQCFFRSILASKRVVLCCPSDLIDDAFSHSLGEKQKRKGAELSVGPRILCMLGLDNQWGSRCKPNGNIVLNSFLFLGKIFSFVYKYEVFAKNQML